MLLQVKIHWKSDPRESCHYYDMDFPDSRNDCIKLLKEAKAGKNISHYEIFEIKELSIDKVLEQFS